MVGSRSSGIPAIDRTTIVTTVWSGSPPAQSTTAVHSIGQHAISIEEASEVCQIIQEGPWTDAQKQTMGKAAHDTVASKSMLGAKKGKRENQEISNYFAFFTPEDKAITHGES
ncbi:unnamed protein product, partial [Symbiodinium microadriaticum]